MADARMNPSADNVGASHSSGLIEAYLVELRHSLTGKRGMSDAEVDDIVDESGDHLHLAADRFQAEGQTRAQAESLALARFGSAQLVARTHVVQARMGAAVATRGTRVTGLAVALTAPIGLLGVFANTWGDPHAEGARGSVHGSGAALEGLAVLLFLVGIFGLLYRHAGLGWLGRAALVLTVASPFIAAPFGWGAGAAFAAVLFVVMCLLIAGVWRMRVLPRLPVAVMAGGALGSVVALVVEGATKSDQAWLFLPGLVALAIGYTWLGWTMWREPALDSRVEESLPSATA